LIATSTSNKKHQKRRNKPGDPSKEKLKNDFGITKQPVTKPHQLSKKALKKLADRKIDYQPFTLVKETLGTEGNYRKLIYNTSRY
jgi:hypothetical protein